MLACCAAQRAYVTARMRATLQQLLFLPNGMSVVFPALTEPVFSTSLHQYSVTCCDSLLRRRFPHNSRTHDTSSYPLCRCTACGFSCWTKVRQRPSCDVLHAVTADSHTCLQTPPSRSFITVGLHFAITDLLRRAASSHIMVLNSLVTSCHYHPASPQTRTAAFPARTLCLSSSALGSLKAT